MRKKIAVVLNGCGHRDGSEIHEAVLTLLAIEECGWDWEALALNSDQFCVLNHVDGTVEKQVTPRNMLRESARIARGRIRNLEDTNPENYSGVIIPGGFGTANNLCNFASAGNDMVVNTVLDKFLRKAHSHRIPIGAICIAPIIIAKLFGSSGISLTLGTVDSPAAKTASSMGAKIRSCQATSCVVDSVARLVTTPAYMLDAGLSDIARGIRELVKAVTELSESI